MRMPRGYKQSNTVLSLNKALYGLRISPLLWQRHFTEFLTKLGFIPVPHEPCCMIKDGVIIFFYVDDIILAYGKKREETAKALIQELETEYSLTGGDDLQWFLGLEVIRDRDQRKIWLSQAAYIDKITQLVREKDRQIRCDTPMSKVELLPNKAFATASEINLY